MADLKFEGMNVRPHLGAIRTDSDPGSIIPDWFTIVKVKHEGVEGIRRTGPHSLSWYSSARLSDCCCEGPPEHITELCEAILKGVGTNFKRCAVEPFSHPEHGAGFVFWSPRNDHEAVGWVPAEHAKAMATKFLAEVANG